MVKPSIYHKLNDKNAILSVFKDQVIILRPEDTFSAIGTYNLDGCSCLLGLGTAPGSAIVVARISHLSIRYAGSDHPRSFGRALSTSNYDEQYMSLVRKVINTMMSNHKLFQLPVVCGIFGRYKGEVLLEDLRERTANVFNHLNIMLPSSFYEIQCSDGKQQPTRDRTVVAVRYPAKIPELYIGDCLTYPASHSGSLTSIFDQFGLEKTGHDDGGNNFENDEENGDEYKG